MALPLTIAFAQFEAGQSSSKATLGDTPPVPEPARGPDDEKGPGDEGEMRPLASFMPGVNVEHGNLHDLMSVRVWRNHVLWRAGVSAVAISRVGMYLCVIAIFDSRL